MKFTLNTSNLRKLGQNVAGAARNASDPTICASSMRVCTANGTV